MPILHRLYSPMGRRGLAMVAALLLAACATTPVPSTGGGNQQGEQQDDRHGEAQAGNRSGEPEYGTPRDTPSPEVPTLALLQQSERAAEAGNVDEAIGYVERAIRLSPRDPALWLRLAELQLSAGRDSPAIQMAHKAIALSGSRPDIQRDAWLVVADALESQGDTEEAASIRQRWRTYRG